ncbi:DASH complex subunit Dam1 domain-containing protein [Trichoderma novae-zelandiae]
MVPPTAPDAQQSSAKHPDPRTWTSRPTTPLRPPSQSSVRGSLHATGDGDVAFPLKRLEPAFAELSDAMADLEANMMHFQLIDESLARFGESFASFLYGLNMNAFCVDFPECPVPQSFRRDRQHFSRPNTDPKPGHDGEATYMTTDISFVESPPESTGPGLKHNVPEQRPSRLPSARGASTRRRLGGRSTSRPSSLIRPRGRALR